MAISAPGTALPGASTGAALEGTNQMDLFVVSAVDGLLEATSAGNAWSSLVPFD